MACALAFGLVIATAACDETGTRNSHPGVTTRVITSNGADLYDVVSPSPSAVRISAPASNTQGNLRIVGSRDADPVTRDMQSCITWSGPTMDVAQPGIALRVQVAGNTTNAITVTNNIWYYVRHTFNVHLMKNNRPLTNVGQVTLPAFGKTIFDTPPLPWRICARAQGRTITVKAWSLAKTPKEPSWTDPRYTGKATVPADWVYPGRPGWFSGHLKAGQAMNYTNIETKTL
jgi:hypothetical protein